MSEKQTSNSIDATAASIMQPWRQDLFERVLRITAILASPVIVVGMYYLASTGSYWMMPVAVLSYAIVVVGTLVRRINYVWRVWAFVGILVVLGIADLVNYGWGEDARIYLISALLFATIFLGGRHGLVALVLSFVILALAVVAFSVGWLTPLIYPDMHYAATTLITGLIVFGMLATALFISFNYVFPRLFRALQSSTQLSSALEMERAALSERTQVLQESNLGLQRRAMYLDASTQVAKTLATVFEVRPLLVQAVTTISQYFRFYHTAIFLLDETGEWAVLQAASSSGGRTLLAEGYRRRRDDGSVIARVWKTRTPSIATVEDTEIADFATPALLAAQSAMTLPLIVGDVLIGFLDVQSIEASAFDQDDVHTLEGLAGYLTVAITNAQRFSEEAAVLEVTSPMYRLVHHLATTRTERDVYSAVLATLQGFSPARAIIVRKPDRGTTVSLAAELRDGEVVIQDVNDLDMANLDALLVTSFTLESPLLIPNLTALPEALPPDFERLVEPLIVESEIRSLALTPIRVDTGILGILMTLYDTAHAFTPLETQLYQIVEELGGVALERVMLISQAQSRVDRERWLREFSERAMRIPNLEAMMVQAAQSLQDAVQADGVVVSIALPER